MKDAGNVTPHPEPVWRKRDAAHKKRYGDWNPTRRLTRPQMADLRHMKMQMPHMKTIDFANIFKVLPEAIRRILQSRWTPTATDEVKLEARAAATKQKKLERRQEKRELLPTHRAHDASAKPLSSPPRHRSPANRKLHQSHQRQNLQLSRPLQPYIPSAGDTLE